MTSVKFVNTLSKVDSPEYRQLTFPAIITQWDDDYWALGFTFFNLAFVITFSRENHV